MAETEPETRVRITYMLVIEPSPGALTARERGTWQQVQEQLRKDRADPRLAGKRLGIIRTEIIEIEHPVEWQDADSDNQEDDTPGTAAWFAESKLHGCTGTGYDAEADLIIHDIPGPCPLHPGLPD